MNAVLRLEFATGEKERQAVQLIIATPTFRETRGSVCGGQTQGIIELDRAEVL
jgi:hypothetical protein